MVMIYANFYKRFMGYNREFIAYSPCCVQGFFNISSNLSITPIYSLIISFQWESFR